MTARLVVVAVSLRRADRGGASPPVGVRSAVMWLETSTPPRVPKTVLPDRVDVLVVGGGYCGLAAAAEAASLGACVAVVEAGALGAGASTRNGGMVIPELTSGPETLARAHGELGRRMQADVDEAFAWVEDIIADGPIDCGYARCGQLYLAHTRRKVAGLGALAAEHRSLGHEAHVVTGADLRAEIGSDRFPAGLVLERTGGLHPARFHAGLVRRALAAGATLHAHTRAERIERRVGGGFTVSLGPSGAPPDHGSGRSGPPGAHQWSISGPERTDAAAIEVQAGQVLLATNAYADHLEPRLQRRVLPMGSFIIATEALSAEQADAVLPTRRMCVDTKDLLWYWRLDGDRRMVFGGRRRLGRVELADAADYLRRSLVEVHPQLADVAVDCVWGGDVALTLDRLPHVGRFDGVWYATGCNGSGVALNAWLGHRMGQVLVGEGQPPSVAELAHPTVPLHRWRHLYLPVVSRWYQLQDLRP